ncbi:GNAT family N-acetyltransferase [Williamsia sp. 1135]|uniref:GNAT family N-acetyltransferase n=1 Tax=Williamsia sp. 1135 TaxID=1889262 RepID=UPI000A11D291|nr:GNAT family N-acetyltransferase [Williamsia sp. 1135]ORM27839.1 GNAT family N-acetyltransferase [Williamsia sp. 1135]
MPTRSAESSELALVDLHRPATANKYAWRPPFDVEAAYEHEQWWDTVPYPLGDPWYIQVVAGGMEVARVEMDNPGDVNPEYTDVPDLGPERLEIQFIEVANTAHRRGIGSRVVRALQERHADRRLFAYSEEADRFWTSLGWERFDHPNGLNRPLFISPPR